MQRFLSLVIALVTGTLLSAVASTDANLLNVSHFSERDPDRSRALRLKSPAARAHLSRHPQDFLGACCPAGVLCTGATPRPEMVLDVGELLAHPFVGIGTNMLPENPEAPANEVGVFVNQALATPLVRTVVGPDWSQMPAPPVTPKGQVPDEQAFYEYVKMYFQLQPNGQPAPWNLSNAMRTIDDNHARGASVVFRLLQHPWSLS